MTKNHADQEATFRSLHHQERPLALSNAWDAASAAVAADAGAPAIATTSAGISWAYGVADGDQLDRDRAVAVVAAIASVVDVPVTADIEGGYADSPEGVAETALAVVEAGAVGINIEDGPRDPGELGERIVAIRKALGGTPLFINARTDVFLAADGTPGQQVDEVTDRAKRYMDAGADGIFVPGAVSADVVGALTSQIELPLNVMVGPGALTVSELATLGVSRVSLGSSSAQAAYEVVRAATTELLDAGSYTALSAAVEYADLNSLMSIGSA